MFKCEECDKLITNVNDAYALAIKTKDGSYIQKKVCKKCSGR